MQVIADLQIHSKYSRAVSPKMNLTEISNWAAKKGINFMATGDWTHPLWFREIKENLKETSEGIYSLAGTNHDLSLQETKFLLSTEISSIYSQGDKVRRVHNLIFSPSIRVCEKVINELKKRGANLMADGRPIVGLSSKDLLQMVLEINEKILFIPAHIWTPWFSVFGSKSGFDSLNECFGDNDKYIYAVETGLSSDPIMNWQIKELESRSIVSFSDAHSGPKLGREATVFVENNQETITNNQITYEDIAKAIKQDSSGRLKIGYTIEFFPEEGKYHWTGHRSCNICYSALETKEKGVTCPVCGKSLTVGVENRVLDLSSKTFNQEDLIFMPNKVGLTFVYDKEKKRRPFVSMVPLLEILLETNNGSPVKAQNEYERLMNWATEFEILLKKPYLGIEKQCGEKLMAAIKTVRERKVFVDPGYDGVFGKVKIFKETPKENPASQQSLF